MLATASLEGWSLYSERVTVDRVAKPISRDAKHIMQLNSFLALVERQPKEFETTLIALRKLMDCKLGKQERAMKTPETPSTEGCATQHSSRKCVLLQGQHRQIVAL
ncbi:unnamed protein product [Effrenium voratum]|nr:unnamed protein product [Effrenium voratum]